MELTYLLFHFIFTLPPTALLYGLLHPVLSPRERFRSIFLSSIALLYTFQWDKNLIINKVWTYPSWSVIGTISQVPVEEVFFFLIQPVLTTLIYTLFTLPIIPALYVMPIPGTLEVRSPRLWALLRYAPPLGALTMAYRSYFQLDPSDHTFYLNMLSAWALPICSLLWFLGGDHVLRRPKSILASILTTTIYLCMTDIVALRAGTWHISEATSTGYFLFNDFPIEEALFFFLTSLVLNLGLASIEKYDALLDIWPELGPSSLGQESFWSEFQALFRSVQYSSLGIHRFIQSCALEPSSHERPFHLRRTLEILSEASKSFYSASFIFVNYRAIRSKFVILYGFCRETDDLIDNSASKSEARKIVNICKEFLDLLWPADGQDDDRKGSSLEKFIDNQVPKRSRAVFHIFSSLKEILTRGPFEELIAGYEYDSIEYVDKQIRTEEDLIQYSRWVAGSVGEMCVMIIWSVYGQPQNEKEREKILSAANDMGVALQLINIARDIKEDAQIGRIYLPSIWFEEVKGVGIEDLERLRKQNGLDGFPYEIMASKLLELAQRYESRSSEWIQKLPGAFQPGMRAATKVYLEIGDQIRRRIKVSRTGERVWKGERIFLSRYQRIKVVVRELWSLGGTKRSRLVS